MILCQLFYLPLSHEIGSASPDMRAIDRVTTQHRCGAGRSSIKPLESHCFSSLIQSSIGLLHRPYQSIWKSLFVLLIVCGLYGINCDLIADTSLAVSDNEECCYIE